MGGIYLVHTSYQFGTKNFLIITPYRTLYMHNAQYWIQHLQLLSHPEGGYYRETYRAEGIIQPESLPSAMQGTRRYATGIYFLLTHEHFSAFHRIQSDEMWHFYAGNGIEILYFDAQDHLQTIRLGADVAAGEVLQAVVPAGAWFASRVPSVGGYALVGCTVSPGFDFVDFEMASREALTAQYPQHQAVIEALTRV